VECTTGMDYWTDLKYDTIVLRGIPETTPLDSLVFAYLTVACQLILVQEILAQE